MYTNKVVNSDNKFIGTTTSYGYSYYFRKVLSLAVIDIDDAELGSEVKVIWGEPGHPQKEIRAIVAKTPYKTDGSKVDLHTVR